jgi:hypothetical protein
MKQKRHSRWSYGQNILDEGGKYPSRAAFRAGNRSAYNAALRYGGLLNNLFPETAQADWSNDVVVLIEAHKHSSRSVFALASPGAYRAALRRGLLPLVDFKQCEQNNHMEAFDDIVADSPRNPPTGFNEVLFRSLVEEDYK